MMGGKSRRRYPFDLANSSSSQSGFASSVASTYRRMSDAVTDSKRRSGVSRPIQARRVSVISWSLLMSFFLADGVAKSFTGWVENSMRCQSNQHLLLFYFGKFTVADTQPFA